jgi:hypothetical protein
MLNPLLKLADWQEDSLGFVGASILLLIASSEGFFLLCWLQLRQQERVAGADFILEKCFGDCRGKLSEPDTSDYIRGTFGALRGNLFNGVLRLPVRVSLLLCCVLSAPLSDHRGENLNALLATLHKAAQFFPFVEPGDSGR